MLQAEKKARQRRASYYGVHYGQVTYSEPSSSIHAHGLDLFLPRSPSLNSHVPRPLPDFAVEKISIFFLCGCEIKSGCGLGIVCLVQISLAKPCTSSHALRARPKRKARGSGYIIITSFGIFGRLWLEMAYERSVFLHYTFQVEASKENAYSQIH